MTLVDWFGISVKPAERCEVFASDENGLRVTLYRETLTQTFDYGAWNRPDSSFTFTDNQAHIFLENTTDGGDTWTQTAYYTDQAPDSGDFCEYVRSVGDTFFVVTIGETVMTSLDNGVQWYDHQLTEGVPGIAFSSGSHECRIVNMAFTDPKNGRIAFEWHEYTFDYGYHVYEITLATSDGGQTWNLIDSTLEAR